MWPEPTPDSDAFWAKVARGWRPEHDTPAETLPPSAEPTGTASPEPRAAARARRDRPAPQPPPSRPRTSPPDQTTAAVTVADHHPGNHDDAADAAGRHHDGTSTTARAASAGDGPRRYRRDVDEPAVVAAYQAGRTPPAIAADHGIAPRRVRAILDRHGIPCRDDRAGHSGGANRIAAYPPGLVTLVAELYWAGLTQAQVADRLDVGQHVVQRLMQRHGIPRRPAAHQRNATNRTTSPGAARPQWVTL
jgi:hypothetical protein